jgi:aryl-alcohol dehydrogenase-like predicted oxidoreductase
MMRTLGRSEIQVSALGLGCWAIGGPFWKGTTPVGWGKIDDAESIRAIQRAIDLGITFFDTADIYGCGHSERVLGQALANKRAQVIIATKFGQTFDEATKQGTGYDTTPEHIRRACDASLKRLRVDVIDLYQLHVKDVELAQAKTVRDTLEELVASGKIRWYGWSTDDAASAKVFADGAHCAAIQQRFNLFEGDAATLHVCEETGLASINRSPLAMGLLTGKFNAAAKFTADDVRIRRFDFAKEAGEQLNELAKIQSILTEDGRTLAQAALGWLWARSEKTIPIPGFKTVAQVEENAGAMRHGALGDAQMKRIAEISARTRR